MFFYFSHDIVHSLSQTVIISRKISSVGSLSTNFKHTFITVTIYKHKKKKKLYDKYDNLIKVNLAFKFR